ncbi:MAG: hypothetical protein H6577_05290 [Lewinellaceae bacterium]|nr:hypothetical protein [Saprospiraceae bacterium]MCB9337518.1 hypothetical protein [Lewinellaceae bacterium]
MRSALTISISFLCPFFLCAQVSINNNLTTESSPFVCQPGVVNKSPGKGADITYSFNPDFQMRSPDAENTSKVRRSERFDAKLKIPLVAKEKFKFMVGFRYTLERYHFKSIVPENSPLFERLNEANLKTTGIAAYFVAPINHKYYTSFRLGASWQGDYSKFISIDNRYAVYSVAGVFGFKKRDDLEYGAGLLLNKGFRNTSVVPFGFLNRTFNEHWGVELTIPSSLKVRYNFNPKNLMLFGTEFSSQTYAMNVKEPVNNPFPNNSLEKAPYHYHRSSIDLITTYYRQLTSWTWLQLKSGYAFNLNSEARDLPENQTYDLDPSGGWLGMVSFFVSPPKSMLGR